MLSTCRAHLLELDQLQGASGQTLTAYQDALGKAEARLAQAQGSLGVLSAPGLQRVSDLDQAERALGVLTLARALPADALARSRVLLAEQRARVQRLQAGLAEHLATGAVTPGILADLGLLAASVGEDDALVRLGRQRAQAYRELADALASLDARAQVPVDAAALLRRYGQLVGPRDAAFTRWSGKLERIARLREQLGPLGRPAPVFAGCEQACRELEDLVGPDDAQLRAARYKLMAVRALSAQLLAELHDCYVLPAAAPDQLLALRGLIGDSSDQLRAWSGRIAALAGPPAPSWALHSGRDAHGPWAELVIASAVQRFRFVPSGTFTMGSPATEPGRQADEVQHAVTISHGFWLADSPCTQAFANAVGATGPQAFPGAQHPLDSCSFLDAQELIRQLNRLVPALGARLPSEAEWEYACRSGSPAAFAADDGEVGLDQLASLAWFAGDAASTTHDVRQLRPNALGLFDMHGEVLEWCEDAYGPYAPGPQSDPLALGGPGASDHVLRGGSWSDPPMRLRAAARGFLDVESRRANVGLRIALSVAWKEAPLTADAPVQLPSDAASAR